MKIAACPFTTVALSSLVPTADTGETGRSLARTFELMEMRFRLVEYEAGFLADHWCDRGHVFYLISGDVTVELKDGRNFELRAGNAFFVSDSGDAAHRVKSRRGGVAFIFD